MSFVSCEMNFVVGGITFVVGGMICMDLGGNFVLRHNQVMKNFQMRNWKVRVDNL